MHVHFVGEPDDGISVSSHHSKGLAGAGIQVSFETSIPATDASPGHPDVIHLVTFEQLGNSLLRRLVSARMTGVQIVRYWAGRDVAWATNHEPTRDFARTLVKLGAVQLCRSGQIQNALAGLGIAARTIPVLSSNLSSCSQPRALPQIFTALCYLPAERRRFHGGGVIDFLVPKLSWCRFLVLGDGIGNLTQYDNVEWLRDTTDSVRALQRSTVFLDARLDGGLSRLVLEALSHGRHVITSYEVPHTHPAHTADDFLKAIRSVRESATFNLEGRAFVAREHDHHIAVGALRRELEEAIEPGRLNLAIEGGVRGTSATLRNLHLLSQKEFPLPDLGSIPPDAHAFRSLLEDMVKCQEVAG